GDASSHRVYVNAHYGAVLTIARSKSLLLSPPCATLVSGTPRRVMKSASRNGKAAGIRDIAKALGTSIGTVDRALHGRSGVRARTKARVLRMAKQLASKPNLAARSLKLNRSLRIAAVLPREIAAFFDPLREGIRRAAEE